MFTHASRRTTAAAAARATTVLSTAPTISCFSRTAFAFHGLFGKGYLRATLSPVRRRSSAIAAGVTPGFTRPTTL